MFSPVLGLTVTFADCHTNEKEGHEDVTRRTQDKPAFVHSGDHFALDKNIALRRFCEISNCVRPKITA